MSGDGNDTGLRMKVICDSVTNYSGASEEGGHMLREGIKLTILLVSSLTWSAGAAAQSPSEPLPTEDEIRASFDRGSRAEASRGIDRLIESRLRRNSPLRPDPVLDRLVGEALATLNPSLARIFLTRAVANSSAADRPRYQLLLADANERLVDIARARASYRDVLSQDVADAAQRRAATTGLARLLLIDRPAEALEAATGYLRQDGDGGNWEAALIASRAARMLGRETEATEHLETAARLAWSAPFEDAAISRIALDRAAAAGQAGDRRTLIALTALVRGTSFDQQSLVSALPECGAQGVEPDDFVIVELHGALGERPRIGIILASRPQISGIFISALAGAGNVSMRDRAVSLMLRCASTPYGSSAGHLMPTGDPIAEWAAGRGIYPVYATDQGNGFSATARLVERESLLGRDSPHLIPVLSHLLMTSGEAFFGEATGARERILGYAQRLNALLTMHDASPDARLFAGLASLFTELALERTTQTEAIGELQALVSAAASDSAISADTLFLIGHQLSRMPPIGREFEAATLRQMLEATNDGALADDPRRRALALRLLHLHREMGNEAAARTILQEQRFADDLCAMATPRPRYLASDIRAEDYPEDSITASLRGLISLEFSLDATGRAAAPRVVIADPPFIFDAISIMKSSTIRYEPARIAGQATPCRGIVQQLRWQLPPLF